MTKGQRQLTMLGVLLAVLAAAVTLRPGGEGGATAPAASATERAGVPTPAIPVSGLRLDRLAVTTPDLSETGRNPFRFRPRAEPVRVSAPIARTEPEMAPVPVGPPPLPPIPLKFIGVLDAPARLGRLAILSDSRGGVFYGKEGDTIEGRYRVLRVSTESADLAYMDGRGRQTIRLSGQ